MRNALLEMLQGGSAHHPFQEVIRDFPKELRGVQVEELPYSAWQLLEHMRIAQADILTFCVAPEYDELSWPEDYWPDSSAPAEESDWQQSITLFKEDAAQLTELIKDDSVDLHEPVPHGNGQTYFRELLLVADHNAYHLGQMVTLRRLLGTWPPG